MGAFQSSVLPFITATLAMISPDRAQRVTDRDAGPNTSLMARPITGFKAKQAGTRMRRSRFMEGAHCRPPGETPSLFAIQCQESAGRLRQATAMTSGKDKTKTDVGTQPSAAPVHTAHGKLPSETGQKPPARATSDAEVADFVRRMKQLGPRIGTGNGRLLFAMDATMSRQPTWDMALALQADMFSAVKAVGGLDVPLVYFRGAGECSASTRASDP